jgi:hypothetical protein
MFPKSLIGHEPSIFFKNWPESRCIQLTAWKIDGLALPWPESIYLIDPPELEPVGFVWVNSPANRKSHVALGRRSEVPNIESRFLMGPPPRWSWIPQNLNRAIIYWHLSCFLTDSGSRFPSEAPPCVPERSPPSRSYLATTSRVRRCLLPSPRVSAPGSGSWPLLLGPAQACEVS